MELVRLRARRWWCLLVVMELIFLRVFDHLRPLCGGAEPLVGGMSMKDKLAAASLIDVGRVVTESLSSDSSLVGTSLHSSSSIGEESVGNDGVSDINVEEAVAADMQKDKQDAVYGGDKRNGFVGGEWNDDGMFLGDGEDVVADSGRDVIDVGDDEQDDVAFYECSDVDFYGERDGISDEQGSADVRDDCEGTTSITIADILELKRERFEDPSPTDLIYLLSDLDGCAKGKTKRKRTDRCRRRPMGPFRDYPRTSSPTLVDDSGQLLFPDDRPWTVPLLLAHCDQRLIALSQLTPGTIQNIVAALFTAAEIGVHMSLYLFEDITRITRCDATAGAFYVSMRAKHGVVTERKRKVYEWTRRFFYVRINSSSVPDVFDMNYSFRSSWNSYNGRYTIGVPPAPGCDECVEHFKRIKTRDWSLVKSFLADSWGKMDFSEFPSLVDSFAGGSAIAFVVETGQCSTDAGHLVPSSGVVVGLSSSTAPALSVDRRREGGIANAKKRSAGGRSPKGALLSKSRKVIAPVVEAPSGVELPLATEMSPFVENVVFEPFEYAFDVVSLTERCWRYSFDESKREEWYHEYAPHTVIASKYMNRLVYNQNEELAVVKGELEKANANLALIKDVADHSEEVAVWRRKYEAEKKVSSVAQGEVDKLTAKIALDAERVKKFQELEADRYRKEKEALSRRYRRAIARHDDVLATCNTRVEKVRRYVENQKVVRQALYGVNQILGVLDAVKVWKREGIKIPDSKVKHLEDDLAKGSKEANLVDVICSSLKKWLISFRLTSTFHLLLSIRLLLRVLKRLLRHERRKRLVVVVTIIFAAC
ncbi:hypothetical protein N665_0979s0012 [Sinapis alba]|nr:hypothetical protein N665_0979s0012 [Sinapis alba]